MPVDRNLGRSCYYQHQVPRWPWRGCGAATLQVIEGTLHSRPSANCPRGRRESYWQPEDSFGVFSALLGCTRKDCGEACSVAGHFEGDVVETDDGMYDVEVYSPRSFYPAPPLIQLPRECPGEILNEVQAAFAVYWSGHGACLNHIRQAIELVLTEMGVPQSRVVGKNKERRRRSLRDRILWLEGKRPKLADMSDQL